MRLFLIILLFAAVLTSCSTDFSKKDISTQSLSGFIQGGSATGVYGKAGLKITVDSITMKDWPISRLVNSLNTLRDTTIIDQTGWSDVYSIQIANIGELDEGAFCDSLIVELTRAGLAR
ncbi:MAG: hypothetical protein ABF274_03365 [Nonlabens sp.]|uniref:hypothetical protein n=1 Tax=Nonlabens sp. TaxID=1888209 RepID=UPI003219EDB5